MSRSRSRRCALRPIQPRLPFSHSFPREATALLQSCDHSDTEMCTLARSSFVTHGAWWSAVRSQTAWVHAAFSPVEDVCESAFATVLCTGSPAVSLANVRFCLAHRLFRGCLALAEFSKIAQATSIGFAIMGFIGFFVKLIFIPINNIIVAGAWFARKQSQQQQPPSRKAWTRAFYW